MIKLTNDEIKKRELDILSDIDKFCKENNIEYFINYGTLLGAVRHKGFIPWDDDIDISMTRENYNKFIKLFQQTKSKYKLLSLETDKNYFNNFIKIEDTSTKLVYNNLENSYEAGLFIDIFPVDYFDNKNVINIAYFFESLKYLRFNKKETITYQDSKIKDMIRLLMWYLVKPFSPRFFALIIEKIINYYRSKQPTFAAFIISKNKEKDILPLSIGKDLITLTFEGKNFPAPKNYDEVLTMLYDDYMTIPKQEDIVDHNFTVFSKDEE